MATYQVISLDVWGNADDGYDVNQSFYTGIEIDIKDIDNDADIVAQLQQAGVMVDHFGSNDVSIDGCDYCLYVNDAKDDMPLCELRLKQ